MSGEIKSIMNGEITPNALLVQLYKPYPNKIEAPYSKESPLYLVLDDSFITHVMHYYPTPHCLGR